MISHCSHSRYPSWASNQLRQLPTSNSLWIALVERLERSLVVRRYRHVGRAPCNTCIPKAATDVSKLRFVDEKGELRLPDFCGWWIDWNWSALWSERRERAINGSCRSILGARWYRGDRRRGRSQVIFRPPVEGFERRYRSITTCRRVSSTCEGSRLREPRRWNVTQNCTLAAVGPQKKVRALRGFWGLPAKRGHRVPRKLSLRRSRQG